MELYGYTSLASSIVFKIKLRSSALPEGQNFTGLEPITTYFIRKKNLNERNEMKLN